MDPDEDFRVLWKRVDRVCLCAGEEPMEDTFLRMPIASLPRSSLRKGLVFSCLFLAFFLSPLSFYFFLKLTLL